MRQFCSRVRAGLLPLLAIGWAFILPERAPALNPVEPRSLAPARTAPLATVAEILNWLPADTETVIHTRGPYTLREAHSEPSDQSLVEQLEQFSYLPLVNLRKGRFIKKLAGQEIMLAVSAARHFRAGGIGPFLYQGCHFFVFHHDLASVSNKLREALRVEAKAVRKVTAGEVFCFEERPEQDVWKYYIIQPKANLLLCATDRGFLDEVLQRMRKPTNPRALPENSALWKHVPKEARFWAVRRYIKPKDLEKDVDPDSPFWIDPQGIGCVFSFNPTRIPGMRQQPKLSYVSTSKRSSELVRKVWVMDSAPWPWTVREASSGVIEVTPTLRNRTDADQFFLMTLFALGHGCAL